MWRKALLCTHAHVCMHSFTEGSHLLDIVLYACYAPYCLVRVLCPMTFVNACINIVCTAFAGEESEFIIEARDIIGNLRVVGDDSFHVQIEVCVWCVQCLYKVVHEHHVRLFAEPPPVNQNTGVQSLWLYRRVRRRLAYLSMIGTMVHTWSRTMLHAQGFTWWDSGDVRIWCVPVCTMLLAQGFAWWHSCDKHEYLLLYYETKTFACDDGLLCIFKTYMTSPLQYTWLFPASLYKNKTRTCVVWSVRRLIFMKTHVAIPLKYAQICTFNYIIHNILYSLSRAQFSLCIPAMSPIILTTCLFVYLCVFQFFLRQVSTHVSMHTYIHTTNFGLTTTTGSREPAGIPSQWIAVWSRRPPWNHMCSPVYGGRAGAHKDIRRSVVLVLAVDLTWSVGACLCVHPRVMSVSYGPGHI
jgi:hypothetical protein